MRECLESPREQSPDEAIAYSVTTTPWGSSPGTIVLVVWDITDGNNPVDVTSSVTTGANSASGDVITTKRIGSLTVAHSYRVDVKFTDGNSNTFECFFVLHCRD